MEWTGLMKEFVHQLVSVVRGSVHVYLAVTQDKPEEQRPSVWREYNEAFEKEIVMDLLDVLQKKNCGIAEVCHATLKLLDASARLSDAAEAKSTEEQGIKAWYVPIKH
jgi:hypothetical protein